MGARRRGSSKARGHDGDAQAALETLRGLCKDERFADDEEAKALLAEAERLIDGKQP